MNIKFFHVLAFILFCSCTTQKQEIEYIEFEHECRMRIKSDRIFIRILPSRNKDQRTVELNYNGKYFMRKPISENEYQQIVEVIKNIEEESSHVDENGIETMILDGSYNTITYRKGLLNITHTSRSLSKDWYPSFHNASKQIAEGAGLDFSNIR
ncbi:hypothetical protein [Chryseobacterium luquanense]|uniref:Lipoprotein n=1 Tax=Chryseobacterium luquanense TaxID=2983766 RepID=A0ABT3Y996_9FLAO|nr:hypothetical protein [Chryseobacterium luquanense]MCX8534698.1 hypothetical protein [Chryseobacterium luquanense]